MNSVKVEATPQAPPSKKGIGLADGVVFVLSCTIGSGLFFSPVEAAQAVRDPWLTLLAFLLAGLLSLTGSLIYSELGTSLVSASAESYYLEKAFGPAVSFTFSWTLCTIIGPSACACISWVLGRYVRSMFDTDSPDVIFIVALCVIAFLCVVNLLNPNYILLLNRFNVVCKVLAVTVVVVGGAVAFFGGFQETPFVMESFVQEARTTTFGMAVMLACFALSGWNMLNPLTEEMTDPARDVPKVYTLGMVSTMVLALLVCASFFAALSPAVCHDKNTTALAAPLANVLFAPGLARSAFRVVLSVLICFCCLGSCNGIMMGTSKCIASNGRQGVLPRTLGVTSRKHGVPFVSLLFFSVWTGVLICVLRVDPPKAVDFIVTVYSVGQWGFFVLVGLSLFVLRYKYPGLERPYKMHLYPVAPAFFVLGALLIVAMTFENIVAATVATVIILIGTALYFASKVESCRKVYFAVAACVPDLGRDESDDSVQMGKTKNVAAEG